MPVFTEESTASRDLRVLPRYAPPLPDLNTTERTNDTSFGDGEDRVEKYDVVVVGAGPAGLMLTLLLSRYGLKDAQLLCIDSKPGTLRSGQADGLQPRTLEVLKSLGLAEEVLTEGCQMWEVAFWNPGANGKGIERTAYVPDVAVPARFPHEITIHQGRIERILASDLARYSKRGVQFSTELKSLVIDEAGDRDFPVKLEVLVNSDDGSMHSKTIRARHVCGADGAHSVVRRETGLGLVGESKDHIWGVTDFVVDTDFPDIRRRTAIHSEAGSVMIIPREQIANGDYLTRLYVQVDETAPSEDSNDAETNAEKNKKAEARAKRSQITFDTIFTQAQRVLAPYKLGMKKGAIIDWSAAYQIGQRMTDKFIKRDTKGAPRVFILGDACHTHSPKAGQGMNVSMMDSYNLAWKLAYQVKGVLPPSETSATQLLESYETERQKIAQELIEFDTKFSSMFSGKISAATGDPDAAGALTHEQFLEVFSQGNGFTSGCGIEYPQSELVTTTSSRHPIRAVQHESDYLDGILKPGRRLLDVRVIRHADSNPRALQDGKFHKDFPSTGRFRILILTSTDLLDSDGRSAQALRDAGLAVESRPRGALEVVVLHCLKDIRGIKWTDLPAEIKEYAEMRFHSAVPDDAPADPSPLKRKKYGAEDAYSIYGVDPEKGAIAVVRPDGYVGLIATLEEGSRVLAYLSKWIRQR